MRAKLRTGQKPRPPRVVFLFDVDNTLLDNDRVIEDLRAHLKQEVGSKKCGRYWRIFEQRRSRLGYADYLGALQAYRDEYPHDMHLLTVSRFLIDYPFANRLFPNSLDVIRQVGQWGLTALLTDGDVVFQPRKVQRAGLQEAVEGRVLVYVHKEQQLRDVQHHYPADHYVVIDDKLRLLTAIKRAWKTRVTTVFPRQGHYARDPKILAECPAADVTVERIGELAYLDRDTLLEAARTGPRPVAAGRKARVAQF